MSRNTIIISCVLCVGIIVSAICLIYIPRIGKHPVSITVAPANAQIKVDGKDASRGIIYLPPGKYTLSASKEGFSEDEGSKSTINIDSSSTDDVDVALFLTPSSEEAVTYYDDHQQEWLEAEGVVGMLADEAGKKAQDKNPILDMLPYRGALFNIDYRTSDDTDDHIVVQITASDASGRAYAIKYIKDHGYDISKYTVEFIREGIDE